MKPKIQWENEKKYVIDQLLWNTTYHPKAYGQLAYDKGHALFIHMYVDEKEPKALYKHANDPVYKDSCLECFLNLNVHQNKYLNIEVNANGAMLVGFGENRSNRESFEIKDQPIAYKDENGWGFVLKLKEEFLIERFGSLSDGWKGNFYKCGDECEEVHFLSWKCIETEKPNFHLSEYFGELNK